MSMSSRDGERRPGPLYAAPRCRRLKVAKVFAPLFLKSSPFLPSVRPGQRNIK
jgi:hypothetical protein